jgi:hypothetical protein
MGLLGKEIWETIFPPHLHTIGPNDVVPYQVRGMVNSQLRKLAGHLIREEFTEARTRGKGTAEKAITKVRKDTLKLKRGMAMLGNAKTEA